MNDKTIELAGKVWRPVIKPLVRGKAREATHIFSGEIVNKKFNFMDLSYEKIERLAEICLTDMELLDVNSNEVAVLDGVEDDIFDQEKGSVVFYSLIAMVLEVTFKKKLAASSGIEKATQE